MGAFLIFPAAAAGGSGRWKMRNVPISSLVQNVTEVTAAGGQVCDLGTDNPDAVGTEKLCAAS